MPYSWKRILIPLLLSSLMAAVLPCMALAGAGDPLPAGVTVLKAFASGKAQPVGRVHSVRGPVVLIHAESPKKGYVARANLPVFKGDMVITRSGGRIRIALNDGSSFVMTPLSRITIDEAVFDPVKKQRSTFLGMDMGKARFLVNKLLGFSANRFRVTTRTAILGVRGSDFVSDIPEKETTVATTLEDTLLDVGSTTVIAKPVALKDFERSTVRKGQPPTPAEAVAYDIIQRLKKDFVFEPEGGGGGAAVGASVAASPMTRAGNCSATGPAGSISGNKAADRIGAWIGGGGN